MDSQQVNGPFRSRPQQTNELKSQFFRRDINHPSIVGYTEDYDSQHRNNN